MSDREPDTRVPDWDGLLEYLPLLEADDFEVGSMVRQEGGAYCFDYSRTAYAFMRAVYETDVFLPFNWPQWQVRAAQLTTEPEALAHADLEEIRMLLTTHVRKERFCEGHFAAALESGHMRAVLRRVAEIRGAEGRARGER